VSTRGSSLELLQHLDGHLPGRLPKSLAAQHDPSGPAAQDHLTGAARAARPGLCARDNRVTYASAFRPAGIVVHIGRMTQTAGCEHFEQLLAAGRPEARNDRFTSLKSRHRPVVDPQFDTINRAESPGS